MPALSALARLRAWQPRDAQEETAGSSSTSSPVSSPAHSQSESSDSESYSNSDSECEFSSHFFAGEDASKKLRAGFSDGSTSSVPAAHSIEAHVRGDDTIRNRNQSFADSAYDALVSAWHEWREERTGNLWEVREQAKREGNGRRIQFVGPHMTARRAALVAMGRVHSNGSVAGEDDGTGSVLRKSEEDLDYAVPAVGFDVPEPELDWSRPLAPQMRRIVLETARKALVKSDAPLAAEALHALSTRYHRENDMMFEMATLVPAVLRLHVVDFAYGEPPAAVAMSQSIPAVLGASSSAADNARHRLYAVMEQLMSWNKLSFTKGGAAERKTIGVMVLLELATCTLLLGSPRESRGSSFESRIESALETVIEHIEKPPYDRSPLLYGFCGEAAFLMAMRAFDASRADINGTRAGARRKEQYGRDFLKWVKSATTYLAQAIQLWREGSAMETGYHVRNTTLGRKTGDTSTTDKSASTRTEASIAWRHSSSGDPLLWHLMGSRLALASGDVEGAVSSLRDYVSNNPHDPLALHQYLRLLAELPQNDNLRVESVACSIRLLQLDPVNDMALISLFEHFAATHSFAQKDGGEHDEQPWFERNDLLAALTQPLIDAFVLRTIVVGSWFPGDIHSLLPRSDLWHVLALALARRQHERKCIIARIALVAPDTQLVEYNFSAEVVDVAKALAPYRVRYDELLGDLAGKYSAQLQAHRIPDASDDELLSAGEETLKAPSNLAKRPIPKAEICTCGLATFSTRLIGSASVEIEHANGEISGFPFASAWSLIPSLAAEFSQPALVDDSPVDDISGVRSFPPPSSAALPDWWARAIFGHESARALENNMRIAPADLEGVYTSCAMYACCYYLCQGSRVEHEFYDSLSRQWEQNRVGHIAVARLQSQYDIKFK